MVQALGKAINKPACRMSWLLTSPPPMWSAADCSLAILTNQSRGFAFEFVVRQYALHYRVGLEEAKLALRPITLGAR
jgi:hypothetical protein